LKKIFFSVLIPVYNVENYLEKCVESVLCQTFQDFEIILVDDGSTDDSGKICDSLEERAVGIRVLHKNNEGLMMARRAGIELAQGEYLVFLDSDDSWVNNALQIIFDNYNKYQCDLLIYNYTREETNSCVKNPAAFTSETIFKEDNRKDFLLCALGRDKVNSMWIKAVKCSLMQKDKTNYIKYAGLIYNSGEDIFQSISLYFLAEKIVYIDEALVHYNVSVPTSITASFNIKKFESLEVIYYKKLEYLQNYGYFDADIVELISMTTLNKVIHLLLTNLNNCKINKSDKIEFINDIRSRKWIENLLVKVKYKKLYRRNRIIALLLVYKKYELVYIYMKLVKRS